MHEIGHGLVKLLGHTVGIWRSAAVRWQLRLASVRGQQLGDEFKPGFTPIMHGLLMKDLDVCTASRPSLQSVIQPCSATRNKGNWQRVVPVPAACASFCDWDKQRAA